jgi:hypothetical protein
MHRCVFASLVLAVSLPALSQVQRNFPSNALRGELIVTQPPDVLLNGRTARLAPGARIRGEENMLQLSGSLVGQKLVVNYTIEGTGLVKDVWILHAAERARKPWPVNDKEAATWSFSYDAQTWTKP